MYGGLGVQLASAFVSAVLPWDVLYEADGKLLPSDHVIVNQSANTVQGPVKFLIQDLISSGHISESLANRTALATMKQIAAIRQAHLVGISLVVRIICCLIRKSKPVMYSAFVTTQLCLVFLPIWAIIKEFSTTEIEVSNVYVYFRVVYVLT